MIELNEAICSILGDGVYKLILSNPNCKDSQYKKILANKLSTGWQLEKYTQTQVFHENVTIANMQSFLVNELNTNFKQCNSWDDKQEYSIKISSKGKILLGHHVTEQAPRAEAQHNRVKNYILPEGTVIPPLVDMGIFTADGKIVRSMYDKFRQINRFIEIIDDELSGIPASDKPLTVIDFGCGKSYLTFVLYYYLTKIKRMSVNMTGLDLKQEVIEKCSLTATRYGYDGLHFEMGDINGYKQNGSVDMVVTLHACDTATDYALYNAICWKAKMIFSVPCCQHELNEQIASDNFAILTRYGIVKERVAALMTDAVRANLLEYCGYRTQLLEFIDFEHTPKNILIRAVRKNKVSSTAEKMLSEAEALIKEFHLDPTLYRLIKNRK